MPFNHPLKITLLLLVLFLTWRPLPVHARPDSIKVVMDDNYPPFSFRDSSGKQQGILIDQWRLWEKRTGIRVEISAMEWDKAVAGMKMGDYDVIDTLFKTDERSAWLDFTKPHATIEVPIFFDKDIGGITDVASLKGFVVADKHEDAMIEILKQGGVDNLLLFDSFETLIQAAKEHKVNIFVMGRPPALYFLNKYGIADRFRQSVPLHVNHFYRAVAKGNLEMLQLVEGGFDRITPADLKKIDETWHGSPLPAGRSLRYFLYVAAGLGLLALSLLFWNRSLHKMVSVRIDELKTSGEALREKEAFVKTLMNAIPAPVFYKDKDGRYLGFNNAYEEFYGLSQEELIGKSVFEIAPRELAEIYHAKDLEVFEHAGGQVYESHVRNAHGEVRDVIFHKAAFRDTSGQVCGLIGVILDITDRIEKEKSLQKEGQKFRAFFEQGFYFAGLMDTDGKLTDVNATALRVIGADKENVIGRPFWETPWWAHSPELQEKLRQSVRSAAEGALVTFEATHPAWNGTLHYVDFSLRPVKDESGTVIFLVPEGRDITDRKKGEEDRLKLERQLLHAQKLESLGVLSGGIAHDFNNLLHALLGNLDLALMQLPEDAEVRKNIGQAVKAANHAAKLTNMMLAYSGKGLFIVNELDLTDLVEENSAMLGASISKSVTLELRLDHTLPTIMADIGQIQQVVMNLITNASEAIGDKRGSITISTGTQEFDQYTLDKSRLEEKLTAGTYVWLEVSDNGCGMDAETLQKLFDPFFTTKFTGRGLGMSAVLGIVRAHHGAFLVESQPGLGTNIRVLFPIVIHPKKQQMDTPDAPIESASTDEPHGGLILVVDDEEMVRGVCVVMLEELGYETLTAADGKEALRIFREQSDRISLVLLDQAMPDMDGVAVFKELRCIRPDVVVLLASGFSEIEVAEHYKGLGLNGFIQKPFNMNRIAENIRRMLKGV